jgi:hypothetical protein
LRCVSQKKRRTSFWEGANIRQLSPYDGME